MFIGRDFYKSRRKFQCLCRLSENLMALGLVQKETPYGKKASRKSIYSIDDIF